MKGVYPVLGQLHASVPAETPSGMLCCQVSHGFAVSQRPNQASVYFWSTAAGATAVDLAESVGSRLG